MSFETYDVYFSGKLLKGQDRELVQKKLGAVFKLEGARLQQLFSGRPVAIKKGVDMDQAVRYRVAFREAGALVDICPAGTTPPSAAPSPSAARERDEPSPFTLSAANSYDLSDCILPVEPQPIPDIDSITLDKPGVILDETPAPEPPEIDIEWLMLDRPGVTLDPATPPAVARIDTSSLQLSPANQGSLEAYRQPVKPEPLPAIDHLQLIEPKDESGGKAIFKLSEN